MVALLACSLLLAVLYRTSALVVVNNSPQLTIRALQQPWTTKGATHVAGGYRGKTRTYTRLSMVSTVSAQMQEMREEMAKDEKMAAMMQAMRGAGIQDYEMALGEMTLIDIEEGGEPLPTTYDPLFLQDYFRKRPGLVFKRSMQLVTAFSSSIGGFLLDVIKGTVEVNEVQRTIVLRETITSLGPFFIKIAQALSIRPDILSPKAMVELQRLCDKVPSYPSDIAFAMMRKEFGKEISEVYTEITPEPLAAASLGQVYKATLRETGELVAVKVQRPGVLETVSLDLYLAREIGLFLRRFEFLAERTDIVGLLDEFAYRFYDELDYVKECQNGIQVAKDMEGLPVVIPRNYPNYTTRRVFTAEWIEGEKLSQSSADNVQELVNVGVIAYLTQLLDTGFFHADPHPGNLIRTPDGKLALLDFGLMTQITPDQKYGMIEAISHLVHRDYSNIGEDFKKLDFIPQNVDVQPIIPALSNVFDAALAGGGAKSINFNALAADLAQITFDYPFRIPPYFALVIRAIGVLEGIALVGNPSFAIIDEAYPYLSKRLLTDDSPRLQAALRYMIYGQSNIFDVERMIDLLQALEKFSATKRDGGQKQKAVPQMDEDINGANNVREALRFLFSEDGEFFRLFISDEVVKGVDCISRDAARELAFSVGLRGDFVPPVLKAMAPALSKDDKKVLDNTRKLLAFLLGDVTNASKETERKTPYNPAAGLFGLNVGVAPFNFGLGGTQNARILADELAPVFREQGPNMRAFGLQIVGRLTEKLTTRVLRFTSDAVLGNYYARQSGGSVSSTNGVTVNNRAAVATANARAGANINDPLAVSSRPSTPIPSRPLARRAGSLAGNTRFARGGASAAGQ